MLTLGKKHGFSFITPPDLTNRILPHSLTIRNFFNDHKIFTKIKPSLRKRNLLFIEQLLTIDGTHFMLWSDLRDTTFSTRVQSSVTPTWYKSLESRILLRPNFSREIKPEFRLSASHFKGFRHDFF